MTVNDFNDWFDDAPFISIAGSYEFDVWFDDGPVIEQDEGGSGIVRRRAEIF